ncbi:MAG TPA: L,D-transpeptidase family protein, partial [Pyrinomonadaceae bacterium]
MKGFLALGLLVCSAAVGAWAQQRNGSPLTRAQIKEAEQRLAGLGYWTGPVDGVFDLGSRSALIAFQKWEGRAVTAKLTRDEFEALRASEAPKPRDPGYEHVEVDIDRQVLLLVRENSGVRVLPVSTGNDARFMSDGQESVAYTPRGRFVVYDKTFGWEN